VGTWISHLRIAETLLAHLPDLDEVAFAYGNLAPDSGIPNTDWSWFGPLCEDLFSWDGHDDINYSGS
jgi:hypothetical protein